ncbi:MAG TPA: hypothetical protein VKR83_08170 [Ktedonobacteraceae bacterium]|nr:hypothetical protein [Ktedonobacteraceae bacterium]
MDAKALQSRWQGQAEEFVFPARSKSKTRLPNVEQRWTMEKPIWKVVGGERK